MKFETGGKTTVRTDPIGIARLTHDAELYAYLTRRKEPLEVAARSLAPRGPTGDLAASIHADIVPGPGGWQLVLYADDVPAGWVEKGTIRMAAHPFLRPAFATVFPDLRLIEGPA